MADKSLVSVVICFFNEEKFIREAVESVVNQTYDHWELLLVDDGSTDNSTRIAQEYASRYAPGIRYLRHEGRRNMGLSVSRNLGIRHAKGEYIAFLDGDDVFLPKNLELQLEAMRLNPDAAMVYGTGQYWYGWKGNPDDSRRDFVSKLGVRPDFLYKPPALLPRILKNENISPLTCCVLVKRDALDRIGAFEESFTGLYEDQVFYAKICIEAPIFAHARCLAKYRRHPDSLCAVARETFSDKEGTYHFSRLQFLNWLESYLLKKRIWSLKVWWALKNELFPYRYPALHRLVTSMPKTVGFHVRKIIGRILPDEVKNTVKRLLGYKPSRD